MMNDGFNPEKVLRDLQYRSGFLFGDAMGYDDLKSEENKQFLLGMAYAYSYIKEDGVPGDAFESTGSQKLDEMLTEIRTHALQVILNGLEFRMEDALTTMLDDEGSQEVDQDE